MCEDHRLVPKLFRAEVTRAEHRLPPLGCPGTRYKIVFEFNVFHGKEQSQVKILNHSIIMIFMAVILVTS